MGKQNQQESQTLDRQQKPRKARQPKQQVLGSEFKVEKEFGGACLKNSHAKKARPIETRKAMHLTLRSSKAKGGKSFRASKERIHRIEKLVRKQAQVFQVEIYRYANVGNHLHLLVKANSRKGFIRFLKAISGLIARIVLGAERGKAKEELIEVGKSEEAGKAEEPGKTENAKKSKLTKSAKGFWDQRPWTRILYAWTDFKNVKKYVEQNFNEAMGFIPYKPRKYRSTA